MTYSKEGGQMNNELDKKESEYAAELTPFHRSFSKEKSVCEDDGLNVFRGLLWGIALAIPLWALIIFTFNRLF